MDYSAQLVKSIEKVTDVGRDICQPLKLKSWDVFLHESRGPADEYIKKIQSMGGISEVCVLLQRGLSLNAQRQLNQ